MGKSIILDLIALFYSEIDRYYRHFFVILLIDPVLLEEGFIQVNINISKINVQE